MYTGGAGSNGFWLNSQFPRITQDGRDGDKESGYIMNMTDSATAGYKYFACSGIYSVAIRVRGYCRGHFEVKTAWDGIVHGIIPVDYTNDWMEYTSSLRIPDGIQALYFTFRGHGTAALLSFSLS